tara:strand:- start:426 stop:1334 length:909 start_codon:yes stop_codon:yes gene_type:complete
MNNLKNLTIVIVTYLTNKKTLLNCLNSIDKDVKIVIVENSKNFEHEKFILSKFKNVTIICTGKNLGYGGGNNYGLKQVETDYAFILNPDSVLDKHFFVNIDKILNNKDFSVVGCSLRNDSTYITGGFFDEKKNEIFKENLLNNKLNELNEVDWVTGNSMLLNLGNFKDQKYFDENFFLYYEEFDLCFNLRKNEKKIYLSKLLKVDHIGYKSSELEYPDFNLEADKLRNWHWMWSIFYFHKKNYGFISAFIKTVDKLLKSTLKTLFYFIIFDTKNKNKYFFRMYGLFSSMIGKKSFYRGKYFL